MSILVFPVPKLAMMAGAYTEARRLPNWLRTVAVATTRSEPRGSFDAGPSGNRFEDGKPLLTRSAHSWASHDTTAAGLTWCSIQVIAPVLAAASAASSWLIPAWLPTSRSDTALRPERLNASPPAPATSKIAARSTAARRRRRQARPLPRRVGRSLDARRPTIRPSPSPRGGSGGTADARCELDVSSSVARAETTGGIGPANRAPAATSSASAPRADGLAAGSLLRQRRTSEPSGSGSLPTFGSDRRMANAVAINDSPL